MDHFNTTTEALNWIRALFFTLCAMVFTIDWFRRHCWLPVYIHVLAAITFVGSYFLMYMLATQYPHDHPVSVWTYLACALFFTAIVYVVFILYGGADAAWTHREIAAQRAIGEAGISIRLLRQRRREAVQKQYIDRLHLGWGTALPFVAALANSILLAFAFSLPWWGMVPVAALIWAGAVAFFLMTETYSPADITWRYMVIAIVLIGFLSMGK